MNTYQKKFIYIDNLNIKVSMARYIKFIFTIKHKHTSSKN